MKLLKSTCFMIALCMMQPTLARIMPIKGAQPAKAAATPPAKITPAPIPTAPVLAAPTGKTFQSFMQRIRIMTSEDVISDQGVFTDTFKKFIQSSGFSPLAMQTLMQAGRNLHLPLSGDNKQDIKLIADAEKNIDDFMRTNLGIITPPTPIIPKTKPIAKKPLTPQTPAARSTPNQINNPVMPAPRPALPAQQPQPQAPTQLIEFQELLGDQVVEDLELMQEKASLYDIFIQDKKYPDYGSIDLKNNVKAQEIVRILIQNIINKYPSASAEDAIEAIRIGFGHFLSQHGQNISSRMFSFSDKYFPIRDYIISMFKQLTAKNARQPIKPTYSPQNIKPTQESINLVNKKLVEMDQKESLENLFVKLNGMWMLDIINRNGAFNTRINNKAQTVVDYLIQALRDAYPNNKSQNFPDFVYDTIKAGMGMFLKDRYQKTNFGDDSLLYDYVITMFK